MKTTLDLPSDLMRRVKLRAVHEGKKLKDEVAELLHKGLAASEPPARRGSTGVKTDAKTGLPYFKCALDAPITQMETRDIYALIHQSQEEEDLERIGVSLRR